jgi:hypothetical protein
MKPTRQIRADVLAWIGLSETTSVGEDYGHRILECLHEIEAPGDDEIDDDGPGCEVCGQGVLKSIGIQLDGTKAVPDKWWHPSCDR